METKEIYNNVPVLQADDEANKKSTEIREMFSSVLEKLCIREESIPFRESVDFSQICTSKTFATSKFIDLAIIRKKLELNYYTDPWNFVNDVWMMFQNTWLYNRKSSKVYKCCSVLAEIFESEINECMQKLGYCCGYRYVFEQPILHCCSKKSCLIQKCDEYYTYENDHYVFCVKCFMKTQDDDVICVADDLDQSNIFLKKNLFIKKNNNYVETEPFVKCYCCDKEFHQICVLYIKRSNSQPFVCDNCQKNGKSEMKIIKDKCITKQLQKTELSNHIENRVHNYLKSKNIETGELTVRVLSSFKKTVNVKEEMKKRFVNQGIFPENFPYIAKALFVFQNIDEVDICIFGMHVQEYGCDCPTPNIGRIYISYLDSVNYFSPKQFRGDVYHEIILGYLDYVKRLGYASVHVWACPPPEGDDYIFYKHPINQKVPNHKRLDNWYRKILEKGIAENIILTNEDFIDKIINDKLLSILEFPYFENDFWPNILEENLKILNTKEQQQNNEFNSSTEETSNIAKNTYFETEISVLIRNAYKKLEELFFIFKLRDTQPIWNLSLIQDPDPLINCEFMNGRENFLLFSRENHLEFSTLRRAKFSSLVLLHELIYSKNEKKIIYICNRCKCNIETRYHCLVCADYDLCLVCWSKEKHPHEMHILKTNIFEKTFEDLNKKIEIKDSKINSIETCIDALLHACLCRNKNCVLFGCLRMKRILSHFRICNVKETSNCSICKQLTTVCWYHAKKCQEKNCIIPPCANIKSKLHTLNLK